jgi:hypothetical protein
MLVIQKGVAFLVLLMALTTALCAFLLGIVLNDPRPLPMPGTLMLALCVPMGMLGCTCLLFGTSKQ